MVGTCTSNSSVRPLIPGLFAAEFVSASMQWLRHLGPKCGGAVYPGGSRKQQKPRDFWWVTRSKTWDYQLLHVYPYQQSPDPLDHGFIFMIYRIINSKPHVACYSMIYLCWSPQAPTAASVIVATNMYELCSDCGCFWGETILSQPQIWLDLDSRHHVVERAA